MSARRAHKVYWRGAACTLLLCLSMFGYGTAFAEPGGQDETGEAVHRFLQDTFPAFLYHGAYLDEETRYLVVSLKIYPGEISRSLEQGHSSIDEILARDLIEGLYKKRFSLYLLGLPQIKGVSVILTWDGCRRIRDREEQEKILLKDGVSEFDRFELSRNLYFRKLALVEIAADIFSAGKLFDRIEFVHLKGDTYQGQYLHTMPNKP